MSNLIAMSNLIKLAVFIGYIYSVFVMNLIH